MTVTLNDELARFLDEQVKAGRFASTKEALEAGIARLMLDPEPDTLDQEDLVEIRDSLRQMNNGEVLDSSAVRSRLHQRSSSK